MREVTYTSLDDAWSHELEINIYREGKKRRLDNYKDTIIIEREYGGPTLLKVQIMTTILLVLVSVLV